MRKINYTACPIDTCTLQQLYKVIAEFSSPSSKASDNMESLSCETIHLVSPLPFFSKSEGFEYADISNVFTSEKIIINKKFPRLWQCLFGATKVKE